MLIHSNFEHAGEAKCELDQEATQALDHHAQQVMAGCVQEAA